MKRGAKYLAKNIGLLTIGQFGTKLLSFFLVPLYTYVLTTEQYGTYDLYSTTVSLLVPILTLNIADAALRFPLDKNTIEEQKQIVSISFVYVFKSILIIILLLLINYYLNIIPILKDYTILLLLMYIVNAYNGVIVNLSRGLDCIKQVAFSGVICSVVMIGLNILFLLPLKLGLTGYFLANILGTFVQGIYLLISVDLIKYFNLFNLNKKLEIEMIKYSKPLMINNISWWVSSVSDRYIITWMCGAAANGIYSVGYKIPSILNIFQSIFNQAWTLSAVQDFDSKDQTGFFSSMYNLYNFCMIFICSILIIFSKFIASILYSNDFFIAWQYVPFLLIATLFGSLSGYIGGIFAAVKDSKIFAQSSIIGAIINVILNVILIRYIGVLGAAISTAISYIVTWGLRMVHVKNYINIKFNIVKDVIAYIILLYQIALLFFINNVYIYYMLSFAACFFLLVLYKNQVYFGIKKFTKKGKKIYDKYN